MAHIVQIGKRRWLVGMTWRSFEDTPDKTELSDDADRLKASWVAVRVGDEAIQAGYCAAVIDVKSPKGVASLAAMLADSREQPWLGTFQLSEDLWWYVAVRDGHAILPDGDQVGTKEEIFAARDRHFGYGEWNAVEGDLRLVEEFINEIDAKRTPVRSLNGPVIPKATIFASAAMLAVVLGLGYYWHFKQHSDEVAQKNAMAALRAKLASMQSAPAPVVSPLLSLPSTTTWLKACNNVIDSIPLSKAGWALNNISCNTNSVFVHWAYANGATVTVKPDGVVAADGNSIDQSVALPQLPLGANDAVDLNTAKMSLRAWAQSAGFSLAITDAAAPVQLPGSTDKKTAPAPQMAAVNIDVSVSPFDLELSSIPGLRLTKISTMPTGWHVEGAIYGR